MPACQLQISRLSEAKHVQNFYVWNKIQCAKFFTVQKKFTEKISPAACMYWRKWQKLSAGENFCVYGS